MAVKIRLARGGRKARPHYSIVVSDSNSPRDGRFKEKIGTYDPMHLTENNEKKIVIKEDRVNYWLSVGAWPTDRVSKLLEKQGINLPQFVSKKMNAKKLNRQNRPPKKEQKA